MLKKKGLSALIIEIIGGVIVVAIILIMFSGFASPFLEFLSDSKNIEAFSTFTNAMTRTCREGSETIPYFTLGYQSPRKIYAISLISGNSAESIANIGQCTLSPSVSGVALPGTCTSEQSKDILAKCTDTKLCWCLLKITYSTDEKANDKTNMPYCANWKFNGISVDYGDGSTSAINTWDTKLAEVINSGKISKISVLMCSSVQDDIGCNTTFNNKFISVLPIAGKEGGYLTWIQSKVYRKAEVEAISGLTTYSIVASNLELDSLSFDRPVSGNAFKSYMVFTTHPSLTISQRDDAQIWEDDCPNI